FELTDRGIHDIHAHETYGCSQRRGIYARDLKRCLGNVAREDLGPWNFQCQCDCNTSRSCADVQNAWMGSLTGGLVDLEDGIDDVGYIAIHDVIQAMKRQPNAMIGHTILRVVIRPDLFTAFAGADHRSALIRDSLLLLLHFDLVQP